MDFLQNLSLMPRGADIPKTICEHAAHEIGVLVTTRAIVAAGEQET
jgi:hypothetical protein